MSSESTRYVYLDNVRVLAMLFGLFVHAVNLGNFGWLNLLTPISDTFRMALFFCISGFLGAMLLRRRGNDKFLRERLRTLLIPLISCLLILNVATFILAYNFIYGKIDFNDLLSAVRHSRNLNRGVFTWHLHLWFLFSLSTYALLSPWLLNLIIFFYNSLDNLGKRSVIAPVVVTGSVIFLSLIFKTISFVSLSKFGYFPWLIEVTGRYLPFYCIGMILFEVQPLRENLIRPHIGIGAVIALTWFLCIGEYVPSAAFDSVRHFLLPATRCYLTLAIMWAGLKFLNNESKTMDVLRRSIYTFYLFHYSLLYVAANLFVGVRDNPFIFFALIVSFAGVLAVSIHIFLIARSPLLLYLFNGRVTAGSDQKKP